MTIYSATVSLVLLHNEQKRFHIFKWLKLFFHCKSCGHHINSTLAHVDNRRVCQPAKKRFIPANLHMKREAAVNWDAVYAGVNRRAQLTLVMGSLKMHEEWWSFLRRQREQVTTDVYVETVNLKPHHPHVNVSWCWGLAAGQLWIKCLWGGW